jgi:hypothetical protein
MAHEIAKLILEHADTVALREDAVRAALQLGMPLREVEEYLDWLDAVRRGGRYPGPENGNGNSTNSE